MKTNKLLSAVLSAALLLPAAFCATPAEIAASRSPGYFDLDPDSATLEELETTPVGGLYDEHIIPYKPAPEADTRITPQELAVIANIAQKVFDVVRENKPVVNVAVNYANAVPRSIGSWANLANWNQPVTRTYSWYIKNLMHVKVMEFSYKVIYSYGGNYAGTGKYLTGVSIQPIKLSVLWGFKAGIKCEIPDSSVMNVGSRENPLAALSLIQTTMVESTLKHFENRNVYYIQGDGLFRSL